MAFALGEFRGLGLLLVGEDGIGEVLCFQTHTLPLPISCSIFTNLGTWINAIKVVSSVHLDPRSITVDSHLTFGWFVFDGAN